MSRSIAACLACLALSAGAAGAAVEVIDFRDLPVGKIVDEVFGSRGSGPVIVKGFNERFGPGVNAAVVFDTANPTGDDFDLGAPNQTFEGQDFPCDPPFTGEFVGRGHGGEVGAPWQNPCPLGKLLIIDESLSVGADGLVLDPDDEGQFRDLRFDFDFTKVGGGRVTLHRMTLIDVEQREAIPTVEMFFADPEKASKLIDLPITDNNGVAIVDLERTEGVARMRVQLHGSGAISSIRFEKPGPGIDIEKLTNGKQADDPNGSDVPFFRFDEPVTWTYVVTNTGSEQLQNVTVTDDRGVAVSCPTDTLEPDESMECTASGVAVDLTSGDLGYQPVTGRCGSRQERPLYANVGSVAAVGTVSELTVTDSDPSHYCSGPREARIYVRKQKKGPDTRGVPSGGEATFEVAVQNTGSVTLTDVKVTDVLSPDCDREFPSLAPGEVRKYTCTAPSLAVGGEGMDGCSFVNEVVATGSHGDKTVTDSDTSTIELISIDIEKTFKSADASAALFEITVTNNGCDLDSVEVTDKLAPDCERSLGAMAAGDTQTYSCSMPLENEACAEGKRGGSTVSDCDTATFTVEPVPPGPVVDPPKPPKPPVPPGNGGGKKSNWLLLLALALLVGGGLFAWNRMKAG